MSLASIPETCLRHVLVYLDLPDQHSLLLVCRALFFNTVPTLYRSPFRAILNFDSWRLSSSSSASSSSSSSLPHQQQQQQQQQQTRQSSVSRQSQQQQQQPQPQPQKQQQRVVAFTYIRTYPQHEHNNPDPATIPSTDYAAHTLQSKNILSSSSASTSSASSIASTCDSDRTSATTAGSVATAIINNTAKKHIPRHRSSLSRRSHDRPPSLGYSSNPPTLHRRVSSSAQPTAGHFLNKNTTTTTSSHHFNPALIPSTSPWTSNYSMANPLSKKPSPIVVNVALEQLKLSKMARLLQLLIACTDKLQARLPALRYPGYGQHWIRPPCKVDYLEHYTDHGSHHIMIRCFALLFADLVRCSNLDEDSQPIYPFPVPDKEAFKVLYQIQRAFMTHGGPHIEKLSLSAPHTVEHADKIVASLAKVTRLELTELDQEFRVDLILDFVKSHRMLFGPILKGITLAESKGVSFASTGSETATNPLWSTATADSTATPIKAPPLSLTSPFKVASGSNSSTSSNAGSTITSSATLIPSPGNSTPTTLSGRKSIPVPKHANIPNMVVSNAMPTPFAAYTRPLAMHDHILSILDAIKDLERIDALAWPSCILYMDRLPLSKLQYLWLSFHFPASESAESPAARLAVSLEKCRNLQQLRIPIRRSDVFRWAALEKKTAQIRTPILAGPRTKRLPKIRQIHLQGPTLELMECVHDAAFAFQDTLKDLEVYSRLRIWQPTTLDFQWTMRQLTRLKLVGEISLHFSLDSLSGCPAIEELWLSIFSSSSPASHLTDTAASVQDSNSTFTSTVSPLASMFSPAVPAPMTGHISGSSSQNSSPAPSLRFQDPGSNLLFYIRSREMHRIAKLRRLRILHLSGDWQIPDLALRQIADHCTQLKVLTLLETVGTSIGGILLAVEQMKSIERLELRLDVVDLALVRVVTKKLERLEWLHLTSLRVEG